jgi:hypothetical protein
MVPFPRIGPYVTVPGIISSSPSTYSTFRNPIKTFENAQEIFMKSSEKKQYGKSNVLLQKQQEIQASHLLKTS